MKPIAIIPARSGSKGLPNKNIKELCGKPMMVYTIEACKKSGLFSCVHVSTDSEAYREIAIAAGADVPFLRSKETATDSASTEAVVREVLARYDEMGKVFDTFAIMQPTSPLRTVRDIENAFSMLIRNNADSIIGVCEMEHSPRWCNTLPANLSMNDFLKKEDNVGRQGLSQYYRINGAMYLVKRQAYTSHDAMYGPKSYALIMDKIHSIDIDDATDFKIAEAIMRTGLA